jgi:hypothetical protein
MTKPEQPNVKKLNNLFARSNEDHPAFEKYKQIIKKTFILACIGENREAEIGLMIYLEGRKMLSIPEPCWTEIREPSKEEEFGQKIEIEADMLAFEVSLKIYSEETIKEMMKKAQATMEEEDTAEEKKHNPENN